MSFHIGEDLREEIKSLADRLDTAIPCNIDILAWPLPLLIALVERIEKLEQRLLDKNKTGNYHQN